MIFYTYCSVGNVINYDKYYKDKRIMKTKHKTVNNCFEEIVNHYYPQIKNVEIRKEYFYFVILFK